ncbi:MAG: autotransporter outer membrane beta-barrel domain-containing protein, partial [Burkholderiaceae bacterium]|nr:autotransporter outer membrane beta-barrel domain-containing protein [Burkholderiaceae bacterium]
RKRLGDVRAAEGKNGAWVRYDGGKMSGKGLDNDFHKLQIGFDTAVNNAWRLGGALSYTKGDVDGQKTSADTDAYSLAAYGVWSGEKGQFVDVIARVAKLDTELNARSFSGKKLDQTGLSLSGEFGWRFDLSNTVYVEPTVEATYTYINSDEFQGKAKYDVDSMDSLTTKLGVAAGLKCPNGKGSAYVRAGLVHEFLGDGKLTVTGANRQASFKTDGKDTWVEYAVGGQYHINKSTYVYGDIERTSGAKIDEDWRANVGLRYAF